MHIVPALSLQHNGISDTHDPVPLQRIHVQRIRVLQKLVHILFLSRNHSAKKLLGKACIGKPLEVFLRIDGLQI